MSNETVPGARLPTWERFEQFVSIVVKVPKAEADIITREEVVRRAATAIPNQNSKRYRRKT
jgi:hypothetical protein